MSDHRVTLGALDLVRAPYAVLADGFTPGSPEVVVQSLRHQLLAGEVVTHDHDGNRTLTFRVKVSGPTPLALDDAGEALVQEVRKARNALTLRMPGASSTANVYDTFHGVIDVEFDDLTEIPRGSSLVSRIYAISLPAYPYPASETEVVVAAQGAVGALVETLVDACDSAAGWGAGSITYPDHADPDHADYTTGGGVEVSSTVYASAPGSLKSTPHYTNQGGGAWGGGLIWSRVFAAPVDMSATPYFSFKVRGGPQYVRAWADGVELLKATSVVDVNGFTRYWFRCLDPSVSRLNIQTWYQAGGDFAAPDHYIDDVYKTNQSPTYAGAILPILGSVPTLGSIELVAEGASLGTVSVLSYADQADGFVPDLGQWSSDGGGGKSFPARAISQGQYALGGGDADTYTLKLRNGTTDLVTQTIVTRGAPVLSLPPSEIAPTSTLNVLLSKTGGAALSDATLVPLAGSYTVIEATGYKRAWIDSPSPAHPRGRIMVGNAADRSDARGVGAGSVSYGRAHELKPPFTTLFAKAAEPGVGTPDIPLTVTLRYRPRGLHNAPHVES